MSNTTPRGNHTLTGLCDVQEMRDNWGREKWWGVHTIHVPGIHVT